MDKFFSTLLVTLMALINLDQGRAEKVMRPKFTEMMLWSDEKLVTHNITVDTSEPHINCTLNVLQQLHNVDLHIEATFTRKLNPDYFLALNTTVNLCTILDYTTKSPLGALLVAYLKEYGRILKNCPIVEGMYYMHNFWIPEDSTFIKLSEVDFDISFSAYHVDASNEKALIINDHFSGEVVVHDVSNVKRGLLALLPKIPGG